MMYNNCKYMCVKDDIEMLKRRIDRLIDFIDKTDIGEAVIQSIMVEHYASRINKKLIEIFEGGQ